MFLDPTGRVTSVNVESSGDVIVSPLSTSVGWATTGGMYVTSTGFSVSQSSSFTISALTTSTVIGVTPAAVGRSAWVYLNHGTVVANWTTDASATQTQSASYDLYLTDLEVCCLTDVTNELMIQPIPFSLTLYSVTNDNRPLRVSGEISRNTSFNLKTPIKISKSEQWQTQLQLGGATNCDLTVNVQGYEV